MAKSEQQSGIGVYDGQQIATYNPVFQPRAETPQKKFVAKDAILLERGFIARPVYQTRQIVASHQIWLDEPRFLGYRLETPTGSYWPEPRKLEQIKKHHQQVMQGIRAAEAIAIVGQRMLEPMETQQAA